MKLIKIYIGNFLFELALKVYPNGRAKKALLFHWLVLKHEVEYSSESTK